MHASIGALISIKGGAETMLSGSVTDVCGITSLQMGVFGGIIVGLGVAALHNRFYKIELPQVLSFFGGTRFVPIISGIVFVGVGILMFFVWPVIQSGIYALGDLVLRSGYAGTWVYGFLERLLLPFILWPEVFCHPDPHSYRRYKVPAQPPVRLPADSLW